MLKKLLLAVGLILSVPLAYVLFVATLFELLGWASALYDWGAYEASEVVVRQALSLAERDPDADPAFVADGLTLIGAARLARGRYAEAEPILWQALAQRGISQFRATYAHYNLGLALEFGSDAAGAEVELRRALRLSERSQERDATEAGRIMIDLANVDRELDRHAEADALEVRAPSVIEATFGPDDPAVGSVLYNRAIRRIGLGDDDGAEPLLVRAPQIGLSAHGPAAADSGWALGQLGALRVRQERPLDFPEESARARAHLEATLDAQRKLLGDQHPDVVGAIDALANLSLALGDLDASERWQLERIAAYEGGARARGAGSSTQMLVCALYGYADLLDRTGRTDDAVATRTRAHELSVGLR